MPIVKINVTQEDIEHGEAGDCNNCPVALAVDRHLLPQYFVDVTADCIQVFDALYSVAGQPLTRPQSWQQAELRRETPQEASDFIGWFDSNVLSRTYVKPFVFDLDLSDHVRYIVT